MISGLASVKDTMRNLYSNTGVPIDLILKNQISLETEATSDKMNNLGKKTYMNGFLSKQASIIDNTLSPRAPS